MRFFSIVEQRTFEHCECGVIWGCGDWPICPHGALGGGGYAPFTPYVDPHLLPANDPRAQASEFNPNLGRVVRGVKIESREQRRRLMKEAGVDWAGRAYGTGGTEF